MAIGKPRFPDVKNGFCEKFFVRPWSENKSEIENRYLTDLILT